MKPKARANHIKCWLEKRGNTEVSIWDKEQIERAGWPWMRGALLAVVCEGDYEWPQAYMTAEWKRVGQESYQEALRTGAYYDAGSGWCMTIHKAWD